MKKLDIQYKRFGFSRAMAINVPERWEDLNQAQFAVCARMHLDPVPENEFVSLFFGLPIRLVKKLSKFEVYKLTELAGFAVNPTGLVNFFFLQEIPGTGLLAPQSKLRMVTIEHFALFDTYFFDYANDPTPAKLAKFVAALYLKRKESITAIDFAKRVNFIAQKVDKSTQYAIFLNYIFLRKWLSKSFTFLFEIEDPDEDTPKRRYVKPAKPARPDWNAIIDGLVGEDILHYNDYTQMGCLLAFKTINNRIKKFKKNAK